MMPLLSSGVFRVQPQESLECFIAAIERIGTSPHGLYPMEDNSNRCVYQLCYYTGERDARSNVSVYVQSMNDAVRNTIVEGDQR